MPQMPVATAMTAAVVQDFDRPMVVETLDLRAPDEHEIIVRTEASSYCITDDRQARGLIGRTDPPMILGHSAVGVVEEVGSAVSRMRRGDRVIVTASSECGVCYFCSRGRSDQCELHFVPGRHVANRPDGTSIYAGAGTSATYASYMNLREISAFRVDSELPADVLSLVGCGVTSGLGAVFNVGQVTPGSSVVVVGAGQYGLWVIQGCRVAGAEKIIVVEPDAQRRATAMELGATHEVDPADGDPIGAVLALTGGWGADFAFEAAGPASVLEQTFFMARNAGTVILAGVVSRDEVVQLPAQILAVRGRTIKSVQNGNLRATRDVPMFVRMLESGMFETAPFLTAQYTLDRMDEVSEAANTGSTLSNVIVFD